MSEKNSKHVNSGPRRGQDRSHPRRRKKKKQVVTKRGKVDHLSDNLQKGSFVCFDIETTGGNPERNGITEIFAVRYIDGKEAETFYSMVNPKVPIPPIVRRMTGITNRMVKKEPLIEEVMPKFLEFLNDDILVSHNTIGDMKFLRYFAKKVCDVEMLNYYLCTHLLVEKLYPEAPDKSLKGLAEFFDIEADGQLHRATADAYITLELFKVLRDTLIGKGLDTIVQGIRYQGDYESGMRLGWSIPKSELNTLPHSPGVFYLYDLEGRLCFLTAVHNLNVEIKKLSVLSSLPKQLLRAVLSSASFKYTETETAFAASMLEAEEFIKHSPRFDPVNWHQRTASFLGIKKQGKNFLLTMGPLTESVVYALGPIRGGKDVSIFVENMARSFDLRVSKKGLKINSKQLSVVLEYLKFNALEIKTSKKILSKIPLLGSTAKKQITWAEELFNYAIPSELSGLEECTGILAVPSEKQWLVYSVVLGVPQRVFTVKGEDLVEELTKDGLNHKLYAEIKKKQMSLLKKKRLFNREECIQINRSFWWAFFGSRHENVKLYSVENLADL